MDIKYLETNLNDNNGRTNHPVRKLSHDVSILRAEICNSNPLTTELDVDELVEMVNDLFGKLMKLQE